MYELIWRYRNTEYTTKFSENMILFYNTYFIFLILNQTKPIKKFAKLGFSD